MAQSSSQPQPQGEPEPATARELWERALATSSTGECIAALKRFLQDSDSKALASLSEEDERSIKAAALQLARASCSKDPKLEKTLKKCFQRLVRAYYPKQWEDWVLCCCKPFEDALAASTRDEPPAATKLRDEYEPQALWASVSLMQAMTSQLAKSSKKSDKTLLDEELGRFVPLYLQVFPLLSKEPFSVNNSTLLCAMCCFMQEIMKNGTSFIEKHTQEWTKVFDALLEIMQIPLVPIEPSDRPTIARVKEQILGMVDDAATATKSSEKEHPISHFHEKYYPQFLETTWNILKSQEERELHTGVVLALDVINHTIENDHPEEFVMSRMEEYVNDIKYPIIAYNDECEEGYSKDPQLYTNGELSYSRCSKHFISKRLLRSFAEHAIAAVQIKDKIDPDKDPKEIRYKKDGAMWMLGTMVLPRLPKDVQVDRVIAEFVFPELQSPQAHLREKALLVYGNCSKIKFTETQARESAERMMELVADSNLLVAARACMAIKRIAKSDAAKAVLQVIRERLFSVLDGMFRVVQEIDRGHTLIPHITRALRPKDDEDEWGGTPKEAYASLCSKLASTFTKYYDVLRPKDKRKEGEEEEDEEKKEALVHCFRAIAKQAYWHQDSEFYRLIAPEIAPVMERLCDDPCYEPFESYGPFVGALTALFALHSSPIPDWVWRICELHKKFVEDPPRDPITKREMPRKQFVGQLMLTMCESQRFVDKGFYDFILAQCLENMESKEYQTMLLNLLFECKPYVAERIIEIAEGCYLEMRANDDKSILPILSMCVYVNPLLQALVIQRVASAGTETKDLFPEWRAATAIKESPCNLKAILFGLASTIDYYCGEKRRQSAPATDSPALRLRSAIDITVLFKLLVTFICERHQDMQVKRVDKDDHGDDTEDESEDDENDSDSSYDEDEEEEEEEQEEEDAKIFMWDKLVEKQKLPLDSADALLYAMKCVKAFSQCETLTFEKVLDELPEKQCAVMKRLYDLYEEEKDGKLTPIESDCVKEEP